MSAVARQALAAAASTVEGITGHPYFTPENDPGTALVRLERVDYPNPFGGIAHWNVVVILPQDTADAEKYTETTVPALVEALRPHLVVTSVAPQRLDLPGVGILPTVFINGHRED